MLVPWIAFLCLIFVCLALDLGVFQRIRGKDGELTLREAVTWSIVWLTIGASFSGVVYYLFEHNVQGFILHARNGTEIAHGGGKAALQYLTAYVLEESLSVDNLFVIGLVFKSFGVNSNYQHRVLFWGILGAVVARGAMILLGFELVRQFTWLFYIFGAYLVYQGGKVLKGTLGGGDKDEDADEGPSEKREQSGFETMLRKVLPLSEDYDKDRFTTRMNGVFQFTPMLVCLFVVEATDVVFALDSIPAVLAVSTDKFIAFTSNIFAVLGLRSLYFVLAEMVERFSHLETSIAIILVFIGVKLFVHHWIHIPESISLSFIGICLAVGVAWSWKKGGEEILRKSQLPPPGMM
jgi:tellurite resistance protein TerC